MKFEKVNLTLKTIQMKKLFQIVLVSSLSLLCFSCYYDELVERPVDLPEIPEDEVVYYSSDIQPIFTANCLDCHSSSLKPDLRPGNSYDALLPDYVNPGNAEGSTLYQSLPGIGHPDRSVPDLSGEEIAYIKKWIDDGAEDN